MAKAKTAETFETMIGNQEPEETPTEVAVVDSSAYDREYSATPEFEKEDVAWPRLRLAQGLTQEVSDGFAKAGDWVISGYDPESEVVVIPLLYAKSWERKVPGEDEMGSPCPNHKNGKTCPDTKWRPNPKGGNNNLPPICYPVYSYVCYSVTHDALISVDFKKTSSAVAQFINSMINGRSLGNFAVKFGARAQTNAKKQQYFSATVTVADVPTAEYTRAKRMINPGAAYEEDVPEDATAAA